MVVGYRHFRKPHLNIFLFPPIISTISTSPLCACTVPCRGEQRDFETQLMIQSFWKTLGTTSETSQMPPVYPLILYPLNVRDIYIYTYIYIYFYIYRVYNPWQSLLSSSKVHPTSIKVDSTSVAVGFIIVPSDHPKITLLLPRQGVLFSSWMAMDHGIFCETTCKQRRAISFMYMIYDNCWKAQINIVKVQNGSETLSPLYSMYTTTDNHFFRKGTWIARPVCR